MNVGLVACRLNWMSAPWNRLGDCRFTEYVSLVTGTRYQSRYVPQIDYICTGSETVTKWLGPEPLLGPDMTVYRVGHVLKWLCPETVMSRSGYVPKRICPEMAMSRNGYVPDRLCPETVMSRNGYVPKRLCPEVAMSRNGYVPKCPTFP